MVGMTKPFLMLTSRDDGPVLAAECADLPRFSGLTPDQVRQVRMERELPDLDLSEYSGAFVCGSPWDANADDHLKEERQVRAEAWLRSFYDRALGESFPILGLCYGLGTLTLHLGGVIDTHHGEEISGIALTKTDAGREDPLLEGTPDRFHSYVGHHEAVRELAPGMQVLLAGDDTPIQMVRVGDPVPPRDGPRRRQRANRPVRGPLLPGGESRGDPRPGRDRGHGSLAPRAPKLRAPLPALSAARRAGPRCAVQLAGLAA